MIEEDESDAIAPHSFWEQIIESNGDPQLRQIREQFKEAMGTLIGNLPESAIHDQAANADCHFTDCPCVERIDLVMKTYHLVLNSDLLSNPFLFDAFLYAMIRRRLHLITLCFDQMAENSTHHHYG